MISFKGVQYPKDVILFAVYFYVCYAVSYRDREEIMEERSIELDHATLNRNYTQATGHTPTDPLPSSMQGRFGESTTWGDAMDYRIQNQSGSFSTNNPTGSIDPPRGTGAAQ